MFVPTSKGHKVCYPCQEKSLKIRTRITKQAEKDIVNYENKIRKTTNEMFWE